MNRPRDRKSAAGLLPRMEARPWRDGRTVTYRYHVLGGAPINLGTDRAAAIRRVLDMGAGSNDAGTVARLWEQYRDGPQWTALRERTRDDYVAYSRPLLAVFGDVHAAAITAPDVARYLRVERADAPKRANREISLLANLIGLAIERGEAEHNPCRGGQVRRNPERPRSQAPDPDDLAALLRHAAAKGGQWAVVTAAAEFAALTGARQVEFLPLHWPAWPTDGPRLNRGKQRAGVVKVDRIATSPALDALRERLQQLAAEPRIGVVFRNRAGNVYTASGFAGMWGKLMREALAAGVVHRRFTFHDLRSHYATTHKAITGALPDLHASPTTTARVYERSKEARRRAL